MHKEGANMVCGHSCILTYTDKTSELDAGITLFKDHLIKFIHPQLHDFSKKINPTMTNIVSKCASVGKSHASIESRMLKECGGLFSIMTYYHSSIICHKEGIPSTNHLFLKEAKFWPYTNARNNHKPDFWISVQV
jgi:hypothetical protein